MAIIEALGNRYTSKSQGVADGDEHGAVKDFEAGLAYAGAGGRDFANLKIAYQERSLTAHAAVMHGDELYGAAFPRMRALDKNSTIRFSRGIVPRLQYTCNQGLRQALRDLLLSRFPSDNPSAWIAAYSGL